MCKNNYIGDGVTCEVKQLPISRCLQNNGQCHRDAKCTDLHFEGTRERHSSGSSLDDEVLSRSVSCRVNAYCYCERGRDVCLQQPI